MSNEIVALRLEVVEFSDELHALSSQEWAEAAPPAMLDRFNELLDEARRLLPDVTHWPHRLHITNEAAALDVLMYVDQLTDRLAGSDPAGDSGLWRRPDAP